MAKNKKDINTKVECIIESVLHITHEMQIDRNIIDIGQNFEWYECPQTLVGVTKCFFDINYVANTICNLAISSISDDDSQFNQYKENICKVIDKLDTLCEGQASQEGYSSRVIDLYSKLTKDFKTILINELTARTHYQNLIPEYNAAIFDWAKGRYRLKVKNSSKICYAYITPAVMLGSECLSGVELVQYD